MIAHPLPPRFILYRREWDATKQKWQKIPCDIHGGNIDPHQPKQWLTFEDANAHATWDEAQPSAPFGVGWVLTGDGWFFYDLDNCRDQDGTWQSWAVAIWQSFSGALGECSTSGTGLHIIGRCDHTKLADRRRKWGKDEGQEQEFYTDRRFVALSQEGLKPIGDTFADKDWTDQLLRVVPQREFLGPLPDARDDAYTGPEDDDQLIAMMLRSKSTAGAFGGVTVKDLWEANAPVLARKWPAYDGGGGFDHSSADAALMSHLAFWTGKDMPRMDRLFRRSALMRDKYEKRDDYRRDTIQNAARLCKAVYDRATRNTNDLTACHADMSHDDLARHIFAERWAGNMLFIPESHKWTEWNGKRWRLAGTKNEQITRLRQDLRDVPGSDDAAKRRRLGDKKTIMAIDTLMTTNEGAVRHLHEWDTDPLLLGTPTQIVDLRTGEIRARRQNDFLLRSTAFDPAPHDSTPALWLSFLDTITGGDPELQEFLQRLSGYAATGSTKEHKVFFAFGRGRNGKSTWLNMLHSILSEDYATIIPSKLLLDKKTEQHATDLAHISNARLARASELPVGKVWDEALLKQITGGDRITARHMRQDNFTFTPQCTLIVDANNSPSIRGIDEAFRRRMCVIPFETTIAREDVDPDLPDKLQREGPAILQWIIRGAVKWNESGLCIPKRVEMVTQEYLDAEDTFGAFLNEHFDENPNGCVTNEDLRARFQRHMQALGHAVWSPNSISKEMQKRGYKPYKSGKVRGFRGLEPKTFTLPGLTT